MAKIEYIYRAEGTIKSQLFGSKTIVLKTRTYRYLTGMMADATADIRYYTEGVNSYEGEEAYTKNLIWPEVSWVIERVEAK